jgi:hypothetical protein
VDKDSIKQIICISGLGAMDNNQDPGKFRFIPNVIRKQGHKLIKDSGIPYTILHCSWFIDSFIFYQRNHSYSVIGDTEHPIYFTNCLDFSKQIANAIANPEAFYKEFPVQGSVGLKHPEAARIFFSVYDKSTKVNKLPSGLMSFLALFNSELKMVKHMSDYFSDSVETYLAEDFETCTILGKSETSIKDYALKLKNEKYA